MPIRPLNFLGKTPYSVKSKSKTISNILTDQIIIRIIAENFKDVKFFFFN